MILTALIGIDAALDSSGFRSIRILIISLDGVLGAGSGVLFRLLAIVLFRGRR